MQVPCILGRPHSIHTTGRILIQVVPAGKEKVSVQVPVEVLKTVSLVGSRRWLWPAGRLARVDPARLRPARGACAGYVLPSGPSPCTWLSHAQSTMPDKTPQGHAAGFPFDSTPPPTCSGLPHERLGSSLTPCPGFPLRASIPVYLTFMLPSGRSPWGFPGSLTYLFLQATA